MAAKSVGKESYKESFEDTFSSFCELSESLFEEIDNWFDRVKSFGNVDVKSEGDDMSFINARNFAELLNFLWGNYDLLYHGEIKLSDKILQKSGYSFDFLNGAEGKGYLQNIGRQLKSKSFRGKDKKKMEGKFEVIEMNFEKQGKLLGEGAALLKEILNYFESVIKNCFTIVTKETGKYTPYVFSISDKKKTATELLSRYKKLDFEKILDEHPWSSKRSKKQPARKKQKTSSSSSLAAAAISRTPSPTSNSNSISGSSSKSKTSGSISRTPTSSRSSAVN